MRQPFYKVRDRVDWGAPVFKLTHRIEPGALISPALANHVLPSANAVGRYLTERAEQVGAASPAVGAMAQLKVSTENLGDHIQIVAAERLRNAVTSMPATMEIDRDDEIASATQLQGIGHDVGILMNGWFKTNPDEWPPHPRLRPLYMGFHIRLFQAPSLADSAALEHYKTTGPIGCRDRYTFNLLRARGVDVYLSSCLSLSLPRRLPDPERQTETFIVSRDERILQYLPRELSERAEFISHYSGDRDHDANMVRARALLDRYRTRAKLIVTTMLHCALPAIAMGIPVVVIYPPNEGAQHASDRERFTALEDLVPIHDPGDLRLVDWSGATPPVEQIKMVIVDKMAAHSKRWGQLRSKPLGPIAPSELLPAPA